MIHHFSLCTQLRNIFNCNWLMELLITAFGGIYLPFSSFFPPPDCLSGCSKYVGETGGCLPSWFHPAKLLFEAASMRRVLWDCPVIRSGLRWRLCLFKRRLIGELLVTFSWSTLCDYSVNYIQFILLLLSMRQKRPRRPPAPDRPVSAVSRKVSLHMPCHVKKRHRFLKRCRIK